MPHKRSMFERVNIRSKEAELIGAVNTVVQENGVLTGYNTDGKGYMRAVEDAGFNIIGKKMTILGTGGAAASIIAQAALDGVSAVDVIAQKRSFLGRDGESGESRQCSNRLQNSDV